MTWVLLAYSKLSTDAGFYRGFSKSTQRVDLSKEFEKARGARRVNGSGGFIRTSSQLSSRIPRDKVFGEIYLGKIIFVGLVFFC